jgi:hypothetical protein
VPTLSRCGVWLPGPGHGEPITATTRIHPLAGTGVTVLAERALGIRRGTLLCGPEREGVPRDPAAWRSATGSVLLCRGLVLGVVGPEIGP